MGTKHYNKKNLFKSLTENSIEIFSPQHLSTSYKYFLIKQSILFISFLALISSGCTWNASIKNLDEASTGSGGSSEIGSMGPECDDDVFTNVKCKVSQAGKIVTSSIGSSVTSWSNPTSSNTITASIPTGYYTGQMCYLQDTNLIPSNIKNDTSIFGVTGSLQEAYAACSDNALNASQCSTAVNRYVYTAQYGGRNTNCSLGANVTACWTNATNQYVSSTLGGNINGSNASLSATITAGYYDGTTTASMSDTNLVASNIKSGTNVFGVTGSYAGNFQTAMASSALRDAGVVVVSNLTGQTTSNQITLDNEQNTYAGSDLPTTGGYNYRDIPDMTKDDEGYYGTTCKYAPRPSNDCGTTQNTIAARIADCATQNPSSSTWNGATQCSSGQGVWKLVTRNGANKEVWQDQRTGQIWSSKVTSAMNWCQVSGNAQETPLTFINSFNNAAGTPIVGNGNIGTMGSGASSNTETITVTFSDATNFTVSGTGGAGGCQGGSISGGLTTTAGSTATYSKAGECSFTLTQGSTNFAANDKFTLQSVANATYSCLPSAASGLQPASPISYCAEVAGVNAPAGENWGTGVYMAAKGGMGKTATAQSPSVRWRLPSINDYQQANINGIRFVMPDMGIAGTSRPSIDGSVGGNAEWSSSLVSSNRVSAWYFGSVNGFVNNKSRLSTNSARCVGR